MRLPERERREEEREGVDLAAGTAPQSLYVHVPFCRRRCGYCNFTLVAGRPDLVEPYLAAVDEELAGCGGPWKLETLFLGGGTPTQLAPRQFERLTASVRRSFCWNAQSEVSVEANPADVQAELLGAMAAAGVNRVSLGSQSLDPAKLSLLERDHGPEEVRRAVDAIRSKLPGASVSLDLIFGTPGETGPGWLADLEAALALEPDHVSTYGLTWEKGTAFWGRQRRGELAAAGEELEREMYLEGIDRLSAAGLEHYEVSNFARPGHRCRHNEVYWNAEEYWAVGPGAARYLAGERGVNFRSTSRYLRAMARRESPVAQRERLGPEDRAREALVLGLRRIAGVDEAEFARRFGFSPSELGGKELSEYLDRGWLARQGGRLHLTRAGLVISDGLWPAFLRC